MKHLLTKSTLLLIAVAVLTATSTFAAVNSNLSRGIVLVKSGGYSDSIPYLRKAVEADPDNPEANYYLGLALNRTAKGKESESFLKRSLMENPEDPATNYELGRHYFEKDVPAEAGDYFEQVIQTAPGSDLALKSEAYLKKINDKPAPKSWELLLYAGGQYDSNVILNGRGMPLPQGYSGASDWSALVNLRAGYTPVRSEDGELSFGYSFYQNLHSKLHDFDITQNLLEVSGIHHVTGNASIKGVYSFEYLQLNGRQYDFANSIAPSIILKSDLGTTSLDYRARITKYSNSDKFPDNSARNGSNHQIGINHLVPVSDSSAMFAIYTHDVDLTQRKEWDYDGDHLTLGVRTVLPLGITGDLSGDIYWKSYRSQDPAFNATRGDTQYTATLSLSKSFTDNYGISFSQSLSRNNSNIPEFSYNRAISSLLLNAKF